MAQKGSCMIDMIKEKLLEKAITSEQEIIPCSVDEISTLLVNNKYSLPMDYRQFLLAMGKKAGRFMQGTDFFYPEILSLKKEAIDLLIENEEDFSLPEEAFVFSMHQGYEFLFFKLNNEDNYAIYQYIEGEGNPKKAWNSFNDFIIDSLNQYP